jgi:cobalt-zinc-cadmium efflux system protein
MPALLVRPTGKRARRVVFALVANTVLVGGEIAAGAVSHSSALLADAGHNLADVAALLLAFIAIRFTFRSPTAAHSFGYHRATILSALANVGFLVAVTVVIVIEASMRLAHPVAVDGRLVLIVGAIAFVLNGLAALVLREPTTDLNIRSAMLHLVGDAVASLGVALTGLIEWTTGRFTVLDPSISLAIAALVCFEAIKLGRASVEVLLESTPSDVNLDELLATMTAVEGVESVHDLHFWSLSSEVRALSAHILLDGHPTLEEARVVGEAVKHAIGERFAISHTTLELECDLCGEGAEPICTIQGAAVA